jgi:hypothetical protein
MELAATVNKGDWMDFTDMIFLPVRNGWLVPMFDMVVVDEAQDMTVAQLETRAGRLPQGRTHVRDWRQHAGHLRIPRR